MIRTIANLILNSYHCCLFPHDESSRFVLFTDIYIMMSKNGTISQVLFAYLYFSRRVAIKFVERPITFYD